MRRAAGIGTVGLLIAVLVWPYRGSPPLRAIRHAETATPSSAAAVECSPTPAPDCAAEAGLPDTVPPLLSQATVLRETRAAGAGPADVVVKRLLSADFKYPLVVEEETRHVAAGAEHTVHRRAMVADHIIVRLKPGLGPDALRDLNEAYGARIRRILPLSGLVLVQFRARDPDAVHRAVAAYSASVSVVAYAEPDYIVHATQVIPNDPDFAQLYGLHNTGQSGGAADADIDAPEAWAITTGSSAVVVGILDTGIDATHPDLVANLWTNPGEIAGDGIDNDHNGFTDDVHGWDFVSGDGTPQDDNSHGTHVAGTLAAAGHNAIGVAGVSWRARVLALKFLGAGGSGATSDAAEALLYAAALKHNGVANVRLTSNSWGGGGPSQSLQDAIAAHEAEDILFVAAAGNDAANTDLQAFHPAGFTNENIVAVASTDRNDLLSSFSNYGALTVDLGAPGSSIYSTLPGGGYGVKSGTSMATPHVAGVAALMFSLAPSATWRDIKDALLVGVDPIPSLAGKTVTGGRLNALGALQSLGLRVRSTVPAAGSIVAAPPTNVWITFTHPVDPVSVDAADCLVNNLAATSFALEDTVTVRFAYTVSPVTNQGPQSIVVPTGAVLRADGLQSNRAYAGTFLFDITPLAVVTTEPPIGTTVTLPLHHITLHFNEPFDTGAVDALDVAISQGSVTGAVVLDATTVRYELQGVEAEGALTAQLQKGALRDAHGNPSVLHEMTWLGDFVDAPFPLPLAAVPPAGAQVYEERQSAVITAGDTDAYVLPLLAGQRVSVVLEPSTGLQAAVTLEDPFAQALASTQADAPGKPALVQTITAAQSGGHRIRVSGANGSTGSYAARAILNAMVEEESCGLGANDTPAAAQLLDAGWLPLGTGRQARVAVLGSLHTTGTQVIASEDFEGPALGAAWTTYSSRAAGRIVLATNVPAASGARFLRMDNTDASNTLNEAEWTVALPRLNGAQLRFRHAQWNEELNVWITPRHNDHRSGDAVAMSDKGGAWHQIWSPPVRQTAGQWVAYTVDLAPAAAEARMRLSPSLRLRFQQYDNEAWPNDGIGFDDVEILAPQPTVDWYAFSAQAGDRLGVRLTPRDAAWLDVALFDAAGALCRTGTAVASSAEQVVGDVLVPQTGVWRVRVSGGGHVDYLLLVTRAAHSAAEPDQDPATAPDLTRSGLSFGDLSNEGELYAYEAPAIYLGSLLRLDPSTLAIRDAFTAPYHPGADYDDLVGELAYDGTWIWVTAGQTSNGTQRVFKVDPATGDAVAWFDVNTPSPVTGVAVLGNELFLGTQQHTIEVYDRQTFAWVRSLPDNLPGWLTGLEGSGIQTCLFATAKADTLYRLNPQTGAILQQKLMDPRPDGVEIALGLAGDEAFIGNWGGSDPVLVLRTDTLDLTRTPPWEGSPLNGLGGVPLAGPSDQVRLSAQTGDPLEVFTKTPGRGSGSPIENALDPTLELLNSNGVVLASNDNGEPDGVNARLTYTVAAGGRYGVRVRSAGGTAGDYILGVAGASGAPLDPQLTLQAPADVTLECGQDAGPAAAGQAIAAADCGTALVTHADTFLAGACSASGVIQRLWQAQDACGGSTSALQVITLSDTIPPSIAAPAAAVVDWNSDLTPAALGLAFATDTCAGVLAPSHDDVLHAAVQGTAAVARTWLAVDACGNSASTVQWITVTNAWPPVMVPEPLYTLGDENAVSWSNTIDADLFRAQVAESPAFADATESAWAPDKVQTFGGLADGRLFYFRARAAQTTDAGYLETEWSAPTVSRQLSLTGDFDLDGMPNRDEGIVGTDPLNATSSFKILDLRLADGQLELVWIGGSNGVQYLEGQPGSNGAWQVLFTNVPGATGHSLPLADPDGPAGFFRVRAVSSPP